ncbi:MAG: hypothetical protein QFF03_02325 [Pseudomonadota bacterium]|nr:hypothetical protein [Pseudomonadota bacterium]
MLRPSSARRLVNLRSLVAAFAGRDIGRSGVAALLGCSLSASRNYLAELLDAGVVHSQPVRQSDGGGDRIQYRLSADPRAVRDFLASLAVPDGAADCRAADPARIQRMWRDADFFLAAGHAPARRDPLVAALFGAAGRS